MLRRCLLCVCVIGSAQAWSIVWLNLPLYKITDPAHPCTGAPDVNKGACTSCSNFMPNMDPVDLCDILAIAHGIYGDHLSGYTLDNVNTITVNDNVINPNNGQLFSTSDSFYTVIQFLFDRIDLPILSVPDSALYQSNQSQLVQWDVESNVWIQSKEIIFSFPQRSEFISYFPQYIKELWQYYPDANIVFSYGARLTVKTYVVCPNGYYANGQPKSAAGFYYEGVSCSVCPAGTFNTCVTQSSCNFHPRQSGEDSATWRYRVKTEYQDNINTFVIPPGTLQVSDTVRQNMESLVGSCYPCILALSASTNYGYSTPLPIGYDYTSPSIPMYCPGRDWPPISCPPNSIAPVDPVTKQATTCTCADGYYDLQNGQGTSGISDTVAFTSIQTKAIVTCAPCPAGYFCFAGVKSICPVGTYSAAGASQCSNCTTDACSQGFLRPICPAGSSRDSLTCVSCLACANLGSTDPNRVHCLGSVENVLGNMGNTSAVAPAPQRRGGTGGRSATPRIAYKPSIESLQREKTRTQQKAAGTSG